MNARAFLPLGAITLAALLGLQGLWIPRPEAATTTTTTVGTTVPLPTSTTAATTTTTTLPACASDAECDDANACTVDACVPAIGCRHDPIDFAALGSAIAAARTVDACVGQRVPPAMMVLLARAGTLVGRAAKTPSRARRLVQMAGRRLARSVGKAAAAAPSLSPSCASALGAAIQTAETEDGCLVQSLTAVGPSGPPCQTQQTVSGPQTSGYHAAMPPSVDARRAKWIGQTIYPINLTGSAGCWRGGFVQGTWPCNESWDFYHSFNAAAMLWKNPGLVIEGLRVDAQEDGFRARRGASDFVVRGNWASWIRDDFVENVYSESGLTEDNLDEGSYVTFSCRHKGAPVDNHNGLWTIRNNLLHCQPMPDPTRESRNPGTGACLFKWQQGYCPKVALENNIVWAEQQTDAEGGVGISDKVVIDHCANNILVYTGTEPLNKAQLRGCFTVTQDKGVWDRAVADWHARHPEVQGSKRCS